MRATAWTIGGVGSAVGLILIATVVMTDALPPGISGSGGLGPDLRAILVGVVIVAASLCVAAGVSHADRWAHYVFVLLSILAAVAAAWWAVAELLG